MKMTYEKPAMDVEQFVANEFFAACGDTNKVYKFKCETGNGYPGDVYVDTDGNGLWNAFKDENLTAGILHSYSACGATHETPVEDEYLDGFFVPTFTLIPIPVKIWKGEDGNNVHCTNHIKMEDWEVAKS